MPYALASNDARAAMDEEGAAIKAHAKITMSSATQRLISNYGPNISPSTVLPWQAGGGRPKVSNCTAEAVDPVADASGENADTIWVKVLTVWCGPVGLFSDQSFIAV